MWTHQLIAPNQGYNAFDSIGLLDISYFKLYTKAEAAEKFKLVRDQADWEQRLVYSYYRSTFSRVPRD
jgi:hypothetical protein